MYQNLKNKILADWHEEDVAGFVWRCFTCQQVKANHRKPGGLLPLLPVPKWKWEHITMDFISGFLRTPRHHEGIWVIVDRLTKSAHFIPLRGITTMEQLARIYVRVFEETKAHSGPQLENPAL